MRSEDEGEDSYSHKCYGPLVFFVMGAGGDDLQLLFLHS